jgi:YbgC/YbaW family acyl-CoA thioester hydrolase
MQEQVDLSGLLPQSIIEFDVALIDVDPFFIHYTAYTNWMDRGFMHLLKLLGHPLHTILAEGYGFPIVQCHLEFLAPANLDDHVRLTTAIARLGRTSVTISYDFARVEPDETLTPLVRAETVHVCTDKGTKRPRELPDWLRNGVSVRG